jgi:hypothetical protein
MLQTALWPVSAKGAIELNRRRPDLEEYVKDWIEQEPGLIEAGLVIIGRDVRVEGQNIDLLAVDTQGRSVVIKIAKAELGYEIIGKVLQSASLISSMAYRLLCNKVDAYIEEKAGTFLDRLLGLRGAAEWASNCNRDSRIIIIGTSRVPGLDGVVEYLSGTFDLPIGLIWLKVLESLEGQWTIVREPGVSMNRNARTGAATVVADEDLYDLAHKNGYGTVFQIIQDAARRNGLSLRAYRDSLMCSPPESPYSCLFTIQVKPMPEGTLMTFIAPQTFARHYPVAQETAVAVLGAEGWNPMTGAELMEFADRLGKLFLCFARY